jgi:hypothetical protein
MTSTFAAAAAAAATHLEISFVLSVSGKRRRSEKE